MTKKKIARPKTRTKPRNLPRMARAAKSIRPADAQPENQPKRTSVQPPAPPVEASKAEPTFTLAEFSGAFGFNYVTGADALRVARNALDDARRTLRLVEDYCVGNVDLEAVQDVVCNACHRAEAANDLIGRLTAPSTEGGAS